MSLKKKMNLVDFSCKRITGLIRLGRRKKQCDLDWKGCNQNSLWICMYAMMYLFLHTYSRTLFLKFTESHYGSRRRIKRQASFPSPTHNQCHPAMGDHRSFVTLLCYRVCKFIIIIIYYYCYRVYYYYYYYCYYYY